MTEEAKTKNILVMDDSVEIRDQVKKLLEEAEYNVEVASNGAEGVSLYRDREYDLVVTDIFMPIMGGLQAVIKLKKHREDIKIIVISDGGSDNFQNHLDICEALGASCFLSKSKLEEELIPLVNRLVEE